MQKKRKDRIVTKKLKRTVDDEYERVMRNYRKLQKAIGDNAECLDWSSLRRSKHRARCVGHGLVQSMVHSRQSYQMVLDIQDDGAFSSATYPTRIPASKLRDVAVFLLDKNYRSRYGKFVMDFATQEVKFRVFRSSSDISRSAVDSCCILRGLPVQMLDEISEALDEIVTGAEKALAEVKKLTGEIAGESAFIGCGKKIKRGAK